MSARYRVIELYSGIGAWTQAFMKINLNFEIVYAYDINPVANISYYSNYKIHPNARSVEKVSLQQMEEWNADIWVMSPPCQPHTRNNTTSNRDINDPRSNSLLHIISLLGEAQNLPKFIFLEVVIVLFCFFTFIECCWI